MTDWQKHKTALAILIREEWEKDEISGPRVRAERVASRVIDYLKKSEESK